MPTPRAFLPGGWIGGRSHQARVGRRWASDTGTPVPVSLGWLKDGIAVAIGESATTGESITPWPRIGPGTPSGGSRVGGESQGLLCA
jgi:hypothetical protein